MGGSHQGRTIGRSNDEQNGYPSTQDGDIPPCDVHSLLCLGPTHKGKAEEKRIPEIKGYTEVKFGKHMQKLFMRNGSGLAREKNPDSFVRVSSG